MTINKQWKQLKETIIEIRDNNKFEHEDVFSICQFLTNYMNILEKQTSNLENPNGWILCSERLPEPNRLVLCYITTGTTKTYFLALWNDIQKTWEEGIGGHRLLKHDLGYDVIAWMPLPSLYEEKDE